MIRMTIKKSFFIIWSIFVGVNSINDGRNGSSFDILEGYNIRGQNELPSQNNTLKVQLNRGKMKVSIPLMKHFLNHSISTIKSVNRLKLKELEKNILKTIRNPENNRRPSIQRQRQDKSQIGQIKISAEKIRENTSTKGPLEVNLDSTDKLVNKYIEKVNTIVENAHNISEMTQQSEINSLFKKRFEEATSRSEYWKKLDSMIDKEVEVLLAYTPGPTISEKTQNSQTKSLAEKIREDTSTNGPPGVNLDSTDKLVNTSFENALNISEMTREINSLFKRRSEYLTKLDSMIDKEVEVLLAYTLGPTISEKIQNNLTKSLAEKIREDTSTNGPPGVNLDSTDKLVNTSFENSLNISLNSEINSLIEKYFENHNKRIEFLNKINRELGSMPWNMYKEIGTLQESTPATTSEKTQQSQNKNLVENIPEKSASTSTPSVEKIREETTTTRPLEEEISFILGSTIPTPNEIVESYSFIPSDEKTLETSKEENYRNCHQIPGQNVKVCNVKEDINPPTENGSGKVDSNPAFRTETSSSPPFMSQNGKRRLGPRFYPKFSVPYVYLPHDVINHSPENPQLRRAFNIPILQTRPSALKPMCYT